MSEPTRQLSHDEYLKALALFVQANENYSRLRQFERTLMRHLGQDGQGHVSDSIYEADAPATVDQFEAALKLDGFEWEDLTAD